MLTNYQNQAPYYVSMQPSPFASSQRAGQTAWTNTAPAGNPSVVSHAAPWQGNHASYTRPVAGTFRTPGAWRPRPSVYQAGQRAPSRNAYPRTQAPFVRGQGDGNNLYPRVNGGLIHFPWEPPAQPLYGVARDRVMNAVSKGIGEVKQAIAALDQPARWSARAQGALQRLVPGGLRNAWERSAFKSELMSVLKGLQNTWQKGASNIGILPALQGGAHAHIGTDNIHFTSAGILNVPNDFLVKTIVHETAHLTVPGAQTDLWYLDGNMRPRSTFSNAPYPFTFNNASHNAETIAKVSEALSVGPLQT